MTAQELINAWGAKRWPVHAEKLGKTFNVVFEKGDPCDTCGYPDAFKVYCSPLPEVPANTLDKDCHEVATVEDFDIVSLLKEVLGQ